MKRINRYLTYLSITSVLLIGCQSEEKDTTIEPEENQEYVIDSFSPNKGVVGTEITIKGNHFGNSDENAVISINGKLAPIVNYSDTEIVISAPDNQRETSALINLRINGVTKSTESAFTYPLPAISYIDKEYVLIGEVFTIKGEYFEADTEAFDLMIGGFLQEVTSSSPTEMTVVYSGDSPVNSDQEIMISIDGFNYLSNFTIRKALQFELTDHPLNSPFLDRGAICPGSVIQLNVNDNRSTSGSNINPDATFFLNGSLDQEPSYWPEGNGSRTYYYRIPYEANMGTAELTASTYWGQEIISNLETELVIEEGTFTPSQNTAGRSAFITVTLSHFFQSPQTMKFTFTEANSDIEVESSNLVFEDYNEDYTTPILVRVPAAAGTYTMRAYTPEKEYELKADGDATIVVQ
ncbi:IPT/TIG domain-containing protein [Reichenbachiella ulvae]|uniref:IPT/TIG domain-containing protein n=1 Tax=Reichenbachiella ulvae TaxID=2980104 RepID=A0ABT3CQI1_9BACT|nr:IPT/TIG domain-containing protein [Reichenbachiella ulvae]MCV9385734.1 IPT/TIG domain-containing protein [Reichenbachiella ulvae]